LHSGSSMLFGSVLAWGAYAPEVAHCLDYPANYYESTKPGALVATELLIIHQESDRGPIARGLGISDPWDFNQHHIDGHKIDFAGLRALSDTFDVWGGHFKEELERLDHLRRFGFQFLFVPTCAL